MHRAKKQQRTSIGKHGERNSQSHGATRTIPNEFAANHSVPRGERSTKRERGEEREGEERERETREERERERERERESREEEWAWITSTDENSGG